MFVSFYYRLRDAGVPVRMSAFVKLHEALRQGLVGGSLTRFYRVARTLLIKSETYFDLYDRVFAAHFQGVDMVTEDVVDEIGQLLEEWLADPMVRQMFSERELNELPLEELLRQFEQRLAEQDGRHDGGSKWIGTRGRSPFGHGGSSRRGVRVGGGAQNFSAIKVAGERRWRDYSRHEVLRDQQIGEAVRRMRQIRHAGARTEIDVDESIRETVRQGGEIELVFRARELNRLQVVLLLDNGGWSMDPYVGLVSLLFHHLRDRIRDLKTYFFHNCVYETLYTNPSRTKGVSLEKVLQLDREYRLIVVGDASMAPEELESPGGAIYRWEGGGPPGITNLRRLAERFDRSVWLNPIPRPVWRRAYGAYTIGRIGQVFTMHDLTLDGIEKAVDHLNQTGW